MRTVMIIGLLVALVVAVLILVTPRGPRVTQIRRERITEDEEEQ
jgi:uncharacterized integral membrane protein